MNTNSYLEQVLDKLTARLVELADTPRVMRNITITAIIYDLRNDLTPLLKKP